MFLQSFRLPFSNPERSFCGTTSSERPFETRQTWYRRVISYSDRGLSTRRTNITASRPLILPNSEVHSLVGGRRASISKLPRTIAVLFSVLATLSVSQGQVGQALGAPTLQKYINVGGGVDEINTGDLTVHVSMPLASKGSYGPIVSTSLDMDSRTDMYNYNAGSGNQIFTNGGFSLVSSARAHTQFSFSANGNTGNCSPPEASLVAFGAYDGSQTFHNVAAGVAGCNGGIVTGGDGVDHRRSARI
jgi:hypothetical protein